MISGDPSNPTSTARNRAERRAADRQRRRRKGLAIATGASVMMSGLGALGAPPAAAASHCDLSVTDTGDVDDLTQANLRTAITGANATEGAQTICFDVAGTITLAAELPHITDALAIQGPGAEVLSISGADTHRIFYVAGVPGQAPVTISGLTLTGGHASSGYGGAVYARGQDTMLEDLVMEGNVANSGGGAVAFRPDDDHVATYTLRRSVLTGNTSNGTGGALYVDGVSEADSIVIEDTVMTGNLAEDGGGAAYIEGVGQVTVTRSAFTGNEAGIDGSGNGGALLFTLEEASSAGAVVTGSSMVGNTARGLGGAIAMSTDEDAVPLTVENSTLSGNAAIATTSGSVGGGGLAMLVDGVATIDRSTITGNTTSGRGGGLLSMSASDGAPGMFYMPGFGWMPGPPTYTSTGSALTVVDSIVSSNIADETAEDLAVDDRVSGLATTPREPASISATFSLIGDVGNATVTATEANGNLLGVDPQLGPLARIGGTTWSHEPARASAVKDAADPAATGTTDQRNALRVVDGRMDMGAVEVQALPVVIAPPTFEPPVAAPPPSVPTTPPTTTPPPPSQPPAPPAAPGGGSSPVFTNGDGSSTAVPLPPAAPPTQVRSSVAVSPTESIAVTANGQIFSTNPNHNFGSVPVTTRLRAPMVGMGIHWTRRTTAAGFAAAAEEWVPSGYWLLGADGGVFSFGTATFLGSTGAMKLNKPVVAITPTPSGDGYWLVASDGGVFSFGDAAFFGSTGAIGLAKPVVAMVPTASGRGYWLVAADGGVFTFGDATFHGSGSKTGKAFTGATRSTRGAGYWLLQADGTRHGYGDADVR